MYTNNKSIISKILSKIFAIIMLLSIVITIIVSVNAEGVPQRQSQDVSNVLDDTMSQLANTVKEPTFGTLAGEWTVFSLARGGYYNKVNPYFTNYYNRIVETVNKTAASVNMNGALHKNKSTENSRLIVALSAIGKDATSVGNWNLVEAYSKNGLNWIKKQGMNGTIWTLIALDSNNYATSDGTIRQQCVDSILSLQHKDGGWSLMTNITLPSNVDITCMTLTALYPYRNQPEVTEACKEAIAWLSDNQLDSGGFPYGNGETSESCAWAIVALTTWGINPDTDIRFIKKGKSAVDNLLSYYVEADKMFAHQGKESNAMATDQACYALVAYDRFLKGKTLLYDMSDAFKNNDDNKYVEQVESQNINTQNKDIQKNDSKNNDGKKEYTKNNITSGISDNKTAVQASEIKSSQNNVSDTSKNDNINKYEEENNDNQQGIAENEGGSEITEKKTSNKKSSDRGSNKYWPIYVILIGIIISGLVFMLKTFRWGKKQ